MQQCIPRCTPELLGDDSVSYQLAYDGQLLQDRRTVRTGVDVGAEHVSEQPGPALSARTLGFGVRAPKLELVARCRWRSARWIAKRLLRQLGSLSATTLEGVLRLLREMTEP